MKTDMLKHALSLVLVSVLALTVSACSDDKPAETQPAASTKSPKKENKVDYGEASDSVKKQFIKTFSANCVTRELKNSVNKDIDGKRFEQTCGCIAEHIAEDLADVDAEKYLDDHEDTHTLQIKFDAGAYFCLQNKAQPKGPHILNKQH